MQKVCTYSVHHIGTKCVHESKIAYEMQRHDPLERIDRKINIATQHDKNAEIKEVGDLEISNATV